MGIGGAVGRKQSVVAEILSRSVVMIPVAAVSPYLHAVFAGFAQRLICKVPNEPALKTRFTADHLPIPAETAHRIAHSMGVFALDQRLLRIVAQIRFTLFVTPIHRAYDLGIAPSRCMDRLLVLDGPRGIVGFYPIVASIEIGTAPGFVTQ